MTLGKVTLIVDEAAILPVIAKVAEELLLTEQVMKLLFVLQAPTVAASYWGKLIVAKLPEVSAFDIVKVSRY